MLPNDLNYHTPQAVYLLMFTLLWVLGYLFLYFYRKHRLEDFAQDDVLQVILVSRSRYNFWMKVGALALAWIFAAIALMGPRGNGRYPYDKGIPGASFPPGQEASLKRKAHDVIFLIDASASMEVADTRVGQTRLEYAKEIVDQVISRLKGENVALYAFTSDTTKLSPPTMDYLYVRLMLRHVEINEGDLAGTNVTEAISDMRDEYFSKISSKFKTLIVLTDGGDTDLEDIQGSEREAYIQNILTLLSRAEENHLRVYTIGMGSEQGKVIPDVQYEGKPVVSSLDEDLLKRISDAGRGQYYFANNTTAKDLAEILASKIMKEDTGVEEYSVKSPGASGNTEDLLLYDLYFQLPLGAAIFLICFAHFFPESGQRKVNG